MKIYHLVINLFFLGIVTACKGQIKDQKYNLTEQIPSELIIEKTESISFDNDKKTGIIMTASDSTATFMYEFWFKDNALVHKIKYHWVSINHKWFVDLDGDGSNEIIRAQGYEDGIDYVIYDLHNNKETPLLYFYPALKDDRYPDQTFWGYPWDIIELDMNSKNELLVSLNNNYFSDGNHTIPESQTELPFIYFKGKTTQPGFKKNDLKNPERYTLNEVLKRLSIKSAQSGYHKDLPNIIDTIEMDINNDGVKDKISIYQNENGKDDFDKDHFQLPIKIYKGTGEGFKEWTNNNTIIFASNSNCIAEGYSGIKIKDNFFTIEQNMCSDYISISSYMTFMVIGDEIILHKYGEEYFDKVDHDREIPEKIWTSKDFGNVNFEDLTSEFLQTLPR